MFYQSSPVLPISVFQKVMTVCINLYGSFCDIFSSSVTDLSQADFVKSRAYLHSFLQGRSVIILAGTNTDPYSYKITFLLSFDISFGSLFTIECDIKKNALKRSPLSWYWNAYKHKTRRLPSINFQSTEYSRTSRKRPPKMPRLSGRSREVAVYKNQTTGGLFREETTSVVPCCHYSFSYNKVA